LVAAVAASSADSADLKGDEFDDFRNRITRVGEGFRAGQRLECAYILSIMNAGAREREGSSPIAVGVYDEPELIVSGVDRMLASSGRPADVLPIPPEADLHQVEVDVLMCDPVGRQVQIEDYLASVAALTLAPILVFTWSGGPSTVRRALAAGARGFLSKGTTSEDLSAAVQAVRVGQTIIPPRLVSASRGKGELSARETEVLDLLCRGLSNLEIAEQLFVSVNSVKTYVRQIYQKIGVTRRSQAVAWGLSRGF
jgi:DNA-binding NarL/FixJ family response regulator